MTKRLLAERAQIIRDELESEEESKIFSFWNYVIKKYMKIKRRQNLNIFTGNHFFFFFEGDDHHEKGRTYSLNWWGIYVRNGYSSVCLHIISFFFLKEKGKKKNNTHASACIIQRGGSRRPKNEGWSVWLGAHRPVYIRIRRKEQPKRKFRRSCCSDEYLKMPAAHGRTDGRTRICQKEEILSTVRLYTHGIWWIPSGSSSSSSTGCWTVFFSYICRAQYEKRDAWEK